MRRRRKPSITESYKRGREREKRQEEARRRRFTIWHLLGLLSMSGLLLFFVLSQPAQTSEEVSLLEATPAESAPSLVSSAPSPVASPSPTSLPIVAETAVVLAFYDAWQVQDYLTMYDLLTPQSQAEIPFEAFESLYRSVQETTLITGIQAEIISAQVSGTRLQYEVAADLFTQLLPVIRETYAMELAFGDGRWGIIWQYNLILPDMVEGDQLIFERSISERGGIFDRNGVPLAIPGERVTLGIIPGQIQNETDLNQRLGQALNLPPTDVAELYAGALPDWFVPIADLTQADYSEIEALVTPLLDGNGVRADLRSTRLYAPSGAHMLGYTGAIPEEQLQLYAENGYPVDERIGLTGLEAWSEPYLRQIGGRLILLTAENEVKRVIAAQEPAPPAEVFTTFDINFQQEVEMALEIAVTSHPTSTAGAAVVLDIDTGSVLALASYPSYRPDSFDTSSPFAAQNIGPLINDPSQPLLNRAIQGTYPPGSIFKIVTVVAAINSGQYSFDTIYESTGSWNKLGESFVKYDWLDGGHGAINLAEALVVSCNTCFYDVGYQIDQETPSFLPDVARQFGLGRPTGMIELDDQPGIIPDPSWKSSQTEDGEWVTGDAVNMAIGQGYVTVTPLQMAQMAAALANEGELLPPKLVDEVRFNGQTLTTNGGLLLPEWENQANETAATLPIDPETLAIIQDAMFDVSISETGTANLVFGPNFDVPVAGKTGTAENPQGDAHAWFVGYTPAAPYTPPSGLPQERPEIAIAILMENGGSGSDFAAPIFREIVAQYYDLPSTLPYPWVEE